jgi:hypothetical protein
MRHILSIDAGQAEALPRRSSAVKGEFMTTVVNAPSDIAVEIKLRHQHGSFVARATHRWIYVFTAISFIAIALTGFIPDSLRKIELIRTGRLPPFPLVLHFHTVLMGSFLLLLLAQATLMATGKRDLHRRLGRVAMVLVPAMVVVGWVLVPTIYHQAWTAMQGAPPQLRPRLQHTIFILDLILLFQLRVGILFPLFILVGLRARTTDPGLHKRMMFLATALPLMAAVDRITWLPTTMPASSISTDLYMVAVVLPMFIWDVIRNRAVHKAYLIWFAVNLPFAVALYLLWRSEWWHSVAPRLMGA